MQISVWTRAFNPNQIEVSEDGTISHMGTSLRQPKPEQLEKLRELATDFLENAWGENESGPMTQNLTVVDDNGRSLSTTFRGRPDEQVTELLVNYLQELVRELRSPERPTPGW